MEEKMEEWEDIKKELLKNPEVKKEYKRLGQENARLEYR